MTAGENLTSSSRSGSVGFTQNNSGKMVSVTLSQGYRIINTITFKPWSTYTGYDVTAEYPLASDVQIAFKATRRYDNGGSDVDEEFTDKLEIREGYSEEMYSYSEDDLLLTVYEIISISPEKDRSYKYVVKIEEYSD